MAKKSNTANVAVPKKKKTFVDICKENIGFFFILPWLFGFLVFKLWPMGSSLFYSFTDYNLFKGMNVIGTLQNYVNVFTTKKITTALTVTFKYAFITVPLKLIFALFIAYILNFKIKGVNFFRTAYYVPSILGGSVAIAVLWKAVFRDDGLLNGFLGLLGITGPSWLSDTKYSLFVICLLRVWQFGSAMIIFLAALKGVPQDLYEAASIDGATKWQQFKSISVPLVKPTTIYVLTISIYAGLSMFLESYMLWKGNNSPQNIGLTIVGYLYRQGIEKRAMGYACAVGLVLLIIVMIINVIQLALTGTFKKEER